MLKYKKYQKNKISGFSLKITQLHFGNTGIKFLENGEISLKQFDMFQKMFSSAAEGNLRYWWRILQFWPKTAKNPGSRMGSGKGLIYKTVLKVFKGQIFVEVADYPFNFFSFLLFKVLKKLNLKSVILKRSL
jgi:ribosomal protein L16/L10AE